MQSTQPSVAVIGGGSFGTAVVKMVSGNLGSCHWWMHNEESAAHIREYHHNPRYLSSVAFDEGSIKIFTDINAAISGCDVIIFAVPSAFVKEVLLNMDSGALEGKLVCSTIKGIIPDENMIVGEYLREVVGVPEDHIVVITGPCHAEEVALERLSYLTVASSNEGVAKQMKDALSCHYIKTSISDDVIGAEYAATLKNVYAIAVGMAHGLGYGDNFISVLISCAMQEMKRFIKHVDKKKRNVNKSAYLGDLYPNVLVNCTQVGSTIKIASDINGYDRFSATFNVTDGSLSGIIRMYFGPIVGIGNSSVAYWGHQLEEGSYATSYIPTSGSAVTRVADVCNNAGNDQVINSTEGVLYAEISALADDSTDRRITISDDTTNNRICIGFDNASNKIKYFLISSNTVQANEDVQ